MKWHIENLLSVVRSALALLNALLENLSEEERKPFVSLSTQLQAVEREAVSLRDASPSKALKEALDTAKENAKNDGAEEEDTPQTQRPPRR